MVPRTFIGAFFLSLIARFISWIIPKQIFDVASHPLVVQFLIRLELLLLSWIAHVRLARAGEAYVNRQSQQQYTSVAMGVKYQDLIIGKGPAVQHRKKVRVSYTLRAKSHTTGKILDSSANFGFRLGKGEVIKGWDIGLQDMRVGGTRRLVVPPSAGYGFNKDVGAGRGADLYFQIELLHVAP